MIKLAICVLVWLDRMNNKLGGTYTSIGAWYCIWVWELAHKHFKDDELFDLLDR